VGNEIDAGAELTSAALVEERGSIADVRVPVGC
jgi:hypothetical protein